MSYYSNPTADAAIGTVDKEIALRRKQAKLLRGRRLAGLLTQQEAAWARRTFVGIHRQLLPYALGKQPHFRGFPRKYLEKNWKTPEKR